MRAIASALTFVLLATPQICAAQSEKNPTVAPSGSSAPSTAGEARPAGANRPATAPGEDMGKSAGIRAMDPKTLVMRYYTVKPADFASDNLVGENVYNVENEEIGEVESLIIDDGKRISGIVLSIGGFLGLGERYVAVAPESLLVTREAGGDLRAVVNTRREDLKNAPEFKFEGNFSRSH